MHGQIIAEQLEAASRNSLQAPALRLISLDGERPPVDAKREPWIEIKYGPASPDDWFGIVPARAQFERSAGKASEVLNLIVKVNPRLGLARNLIPWIVENKSIRLDRPYWEYRNAAETDRTTEREFHVYELAATGSSALSRILPRYYGAASDPATGERALFMEQLTDVSRLDAGGVQHRASRFGRDADLRRAVRSNTRRYRSAYGSSSDNAQRNGSQDGAGSRRMDGGVPLRIESRGDQPHRHAVYFRGGISAGLF